MISAASRAAAAEANDHCLVGGGASPTAPPVGIAWQTTAEEQFQSNSVRSHTGHGRNNSSRKVFGPMQDTQKEKVAAAKATNTSKQAANEVKVAKLQIHFCHDFVLALSAGPSYAVSQGISKLSSLSS
jgi:hypothetical protein